MALQEIFMDFDDEGNAIVSVKGVRGKACKELTRGLEAKLGKVIKEEKTSEYNQVEAKHGNKSSNRA